MTERITHPHQRSSHQRIGSAVLAIATLIGAAELGKHGVIRPDAAIVQPAAVFAHTLERENETARHLVRFDEGLRLPTIGGGL